MADNGAINKVDRGDAPDAAPAGITALSVTGFKALREPCRVQIRPLTLLAGANSTGKSSLMQPLMLMKQTLDDSSDRGPLLLDGAHARFARFEQMLSHIRGTAQTRGLVVGIEVDTGSELTTTYRVGGPRGFDVTSMRYRDPSVDFTLSPSMAQARVLRALPPTLRGLAKINEHPARWSVCRDRCFLGFCLSSLPPSLEPLPFGEFRTSPSMVFAPHIRQLIHLPGLRDNPMRTYPRTSTGPEFPGPFQAYAASVVHQWQAEGAAELALLNEMMVCLGLSSRVAARAIDDTQVELQVGRLVRASGGPVDLVSIADVGLGVSQVLPVVVALVAAHPGQLVYLEQPEIHLHPRAQRALARLLCDTAQRGVRLVVETHSGLMVRGVQTAVAEGSMPPDKVALHWFSRDEEGVTHVTGGDLDEDGAYGTWPEDFDTTDLESEAAYLDAVEARHAVAR